MSELPKRIQPYGPYKQKAEGIELPDLFALIDPDDHAPDLGDDGSYPIHGSNSGFGIFHKDIADAICSRWNEYEALRSTRDALAEALLEALPVLERAAAIVAYNTDEGPVARTLVERCRAALARGGVE